MEDVPLFIVKLIFEQNFIGRIIREALHFHAAKLACQIQPVVQQICLSGD
jgi:hypothetical protein